MDKQEFLDELAGWEMHFEEAHGTRACEMFTDTTNKSQALSQCTPEFRDALRHFKREGLVHLVSFDDEFLHVELNQRLAI